MVSFYEIYEVLIGKWFHRSCYKNEGDGDEHYDEAKINPIMGFPIRRS